MNTIAATNTIATAKRRSRVVKSKVEGRTQTAPKKFLFQLRALDNEYGVSEETFTRLMEELALNQTELVHKALRYLARDVLPAYELDNGPLTDAQHAAISKMSGMEITEEDLDSPLFK
ncbi:hypothetical protein H4F51_04525 [Pectobacterium brasiliense]|uniref:hypothetical protein n=1 Tax=Pectobacterium brasiliense TaxID=180957 RepID=UPI000A5A9A12|nr:hypothetical protein [Pectobacterium brasiliense]MBA0196246.1 hypothetical protein [Pectobacterium brasiliense]MBN3095345.1 hypothetical protein [Pectobacterium brasiliense]MBN3131104.1 hypothetical protein [Pectobacterium brasiliense]MBN3139211.1 hypothetical protein [Pectobacterium brasiliense]MBW5895061.1 hypothetical protein [Pectobacterium brasiliense]